MVGVLYEWRYVVVKKRVLEEILMEIAELKRLVENRHPQAEGLKATKQPVRVSQASQ